MTKQATLFSESRFVEAVARSSEGNLQTVEFCSTAKKPAVMYGVVRSKSWGLQSINLAPFGLYAHPSHCHDLKHSVNEFISQLKTLRTTNFEWNVRYDHADLANELQTNGIPYRLTSTHLLYLTDDFEYHFRKFSETTRNQIRRSRRDGLAVRRADEPEAITAYYQIFRKAIEEKGNWNLVHREALFNELLRLRDDVIFVVAEIEGRIVAGGWFFRDGNALFYWHSAMDREFSRYYPSYAIISDAIQLACDEKMTAFNMGGSSGIHSLEQFKSFWGAQKVPCWQFTWNNPWWASIRGVKSLWRSRA